MEHGAVMNCGEVIQRGGVMQRGEVVQSRRLSSWLVCLQRGAHHK